ncbi:hypothetical protein, partial [Streptomyces viridosporus]|uniref:hypothetical protein n=1 Tax=Streptomyces viridosporus TaxID=67581 RepID=UPI001AD842D3
KKKKEQSKAKGGKKIEFKRAKAPKNIIRKRVGTTKKTKKFGTTPGWGGPGRAVYEPSTSGAGRAACEGFESGGPAGPRGTGRPAGPLFRA